MKPTIAFKTLGCRLNQFETEALAAQFSGEGYEIVPFSNDAEFYVVNTCTVTNQSDHKSRNIIRQAIRRNQGGKVIVTGCMADHYKDTLRSDPEIDYVVDNDHKQSVYTLVEAQRRGEIQDPDTLPAGRFDFGITGHTLHTRSFVKIQDGCDNFCSFCIIPRVRGRAVSRSLPEILDHIHREVDNGVREIVLTGVNIGRYSWEHHTFEDLVEQILGLPGDFRVRISSIEPEGFGDKLFSLFSHPKLTPHLHLCLQSGSDEILRRMRRMYTVPSFMGILESIRSSYPDFNFTTDVIVGFPGETEEDFRETVKITEEAAFSHIHTFKYSTRTGTRAARMEDQVPEKIKNERSRIIRDISLQNKMAYYRSMTGKEETVLIEKTGKHYSSGYGEHYIPVRIDGSHPRNSLVNVNLTGISENGEPVITGIMIDPKKG